MASINLTGDEFPKSVFNLTKYCESGGPKRAGAFFHATTFFQLFISSQTWKFDFTSKLKRKKQRCVDKSKVFKFSPGPDQTDLLYDRLVENSPMTYFSEE